MDGGNDLAPKHAAFPLGWGSFFGFVCTPRHSTYHNVRREGIFTVSYPRPTRVVLALPVSVRVHAVGAGASWAFGLPVVLPLGTSMSAGKTTTARAVVRLLKGEGLEVIWARLTGAGRYRDILAMQDADADHILDFVDAGLPSTVAPEWEYQKRLRNLLSRMASVEADVLVAEIGRGLAPRAVQRHRRHRGGRSQRELHRARRLRPLHRDRGDGGPRVTECRRRVRQSCLRR